MSKTFTPFTPASTLYWQAMRRFERRRRTWQRTRDERDYHLMTQSVRLVNRIAGLV